MTISRREMIIVMGATAATALVGRPFANAAPKPAAAMPRIPLEEFLQTDSLVAALRKGVRAMKKRKPSDPLSWFYQAAIHGVTPEDITEAAKIDPDVEEVSPEKWNQCPHDGEHSADFLPWHRGYTYYFEKILRMHTEDDNFSLPYWNYDEIENRAFPKAFGIKHLDGDPNNEADENINPLHHESRDFYLATYEHWSNPNFKPLVELSRFAVDTTIPMNAPVFFGATEQEGLAGGIYDSDPSTRGLLESYPHDQIHRAVGGIVITPDGKDHAGAMATPPTAGFDPVFCIHHTNIDRLWARWSCMPGKDWGVLPPKAWFEERPWTFFDIDRTEVNEPRKKYFDYRALGIRFKDEDLSCTPLQLPDWIKAEGEVSLNAPPVSALAMKARSTQILTSKVIELTAPSIGKSVVTVSKPAKEVLRKRVGSFKAKLTSNSEILSAPIEEKRIFLRLRNLELESLQGTGFDVHVTDNPQGPVSRSDVSFVGSIKLFNHPPGHRHNLSASRSRGRASRTPMQESNSQTFDVTKALAATKSENLAGLSVVLVPYSLVSSANREVVSLGTNAMKVGNIEFFVR